MSERLITIHCECIDLPDASACGTDEFWLGIQNGKVVEDAVRLPVESKTFTLTVRYQENGNVLGSFAQGTAQDRFFYLCWGRPLGGGWHGERRAKIRFAQLGPTFGEADEFRFRLVCRDAKGMPITATVPQSHFLL